MAVGLLLGGFWLGLGVLLWWWPAAVFVAFSNGDVTPGARVFAVGSMFVGMALLSLESTAVGFGASLWATVGLVGALLAVKPVPVLAVLDSGPSTPRRVGVVIFACGTAMTTLAVL